MRLEPVNSNFDQKSNFQALSNPHIALTKVFNGPKQRKNVVSWTGCSII